MSDNIVDIAPGQCLYCRHPKHIGICGHPMTYSEFDPATKKFTDTKTECQCRTVPSIKEWFSNLGDVEVPSHFRVIFTNGTTQDVDITDDEYKAAIQLMLQQKLERS